MRLQHSDASREREAALAVAMQDVATELRLIDLLDLAAFIRLERFANLEHLVNSSAELYFRRDALRLGHSADVEIGWRRRPRLSLDMVFEQDGVKIFFRLILLADSAAVEIDFVDIVPSMGDATQNTARILAALESSRVREAAGVN